MRTIRRIIIHHSAGSPDQPIAEIEAHHRARGWNGIGYHFIIDGEARLHRTRALEIPGAHDEGENADSIGVCLLGDNTRPPNGWRSEQVSLAQQLVRSLRLVFGWDLIVEGHHDRGPTAGSTDATLCPGVDVREIFA